jgi:hypothetical protein
VEVVFLTRLSVIISFGILPLEDLAIGKIPLRIPRVWRSSFSPGSESL